MDFGGMVLVILLFALFAVFICVLCELWERRQARKHDGSYWAQYTDHDEWEGPY
jgi:hypothetical protein